MANSQPVKTDFQTFSLGFKVCHKKGKFPKLDFRLRNY
nr:MAG TPA: hypothetical protein [Bacteriophage sp.]